MSDIVSDNGEGQQDTITLIDLLAGDSRLPITPVETCIIQAIEAQRMFLIQLDKRIKALEDRQGRQGKSGDQADRHATLIRRATGGTNNVKPARRTQ